MLLSCRAVFVGVLLLDRSTNLRSLDCDAEACTLTIQSSGSEASVEDEVLRFPRASLRSAQAVRVRHGKIRDAKTLGKKHARKLAHSWSIKYEVFGEFPSAEAPGSVREVLMNHEGHGTKSPTHKVAEVNRFVSGAARRKDELSVEEAYGFDAGSVKRIFFGLVSLLASVAWGSFFGDAGDASHTRGRCGGANRRRTHPAGTGFVHKGTAAAALEAKRGRGGRKTAASG